MAKSAFYKIVFLLIFWMLAGIFYVLFESATEGFIADIHNVEGYHYDLVRILLIVLLFILISASTIGAFEVLYFNKILRKKPLGLTLLIKSTFYLLAIFVISSFATIVSYSTDLELPLFHEDVVARFVNYLGSLKLWMRMLYWGITVVSSLFLLQMNDKFGRGVLLNFLLGKYHKPKEETRIFMFLDLKSSTSYAEKLGHFKYSQLLQDCFYDLTDVVIRYKARIYQYVGDEVVLTWDKDNGIRNSNCIKAFFLFEKTLRDRIDYYVEKYHVHPEFKAGLNAGFVTVAEVGELKKELAYHGDAINTASRIRSECNVVKKKLLISADLLSMLMDIDEDFKVESMGVCQLKGKQNIIGLFSVEEKNSN